MTPSGFFGRNIAPACEYCAYSKRMADRQTIVCPHTGAAVAAYHSCKRFVYAPLRRVPRRAPNLPSFSPEDFQL